MRGEKKETSKWLYEATDLKKEISTLRWLSQKEDLPNYRLKIQEKIEQLDNLYCLIFDAIQSVPDPVIRRAMELVYLKGETLVTASMMLPCCIRTINRYLDKGGKYVEEYLQKNDFKE